MQYLAGILASYIIYFYCLVVNLKNEKMQGFYQWYIRKLTLILHLFPYNLFHIWIPLCLIVTICTMYTIHTKKSNTHSQRGKWKVRISRTGILENSYSSSDVFNTDFIVKAYEAKLVALLVLLSITRIKYLKASLSCNCFLKPTTLVITWISYK